MTLLDFLKNISLGGWTSLFIIICTLIEITPIKINPIGWLGKHLNAGMNDRVDKIETKLDNHIAESYRNSILGFQKDLIRQPNPLFTTEEWEKIIKTCKDYEEYCESNKVPNDVIHQATKFIRYEYQKALDNRNFLNLPQIPSY